MEAPEVWNWVRLLTEKPGWGTRTFPRDNTGALVALADGRAGANGEALPLNADAAVLAGTLKRGETLRQTLGEGRIGYLVPASGAVTVNGVPVGTRDGATISGEREISVIATEDAELVMVDVRG